MYRYLCFFLRLILFGMFAGTLTAASVFDIRSRKIPDRLHVWILIPALLRLLIIPDFMMEGILGFFLPGAFLLLLSLLTGAPGGGDIKLCAVCGLFLGCHAAFCGLALACIPAACYGILSGLWHGTKRKAPFALGPFLAFGFILAALFCPQPRSVF